MNKQCRRCGAIIPESARFCQECGMPADTSQATMNPLQTSNEAVYENANEVTCPNCGKLFKRELGVCPNCGTLVKEAPANAAPVREINQQMNGGNTYNQPSYGENVGGQYAQQQNVAYNQQNGQYAQQQYNQQNKPKKKKTGLIVALVILAVLVMAGIGKGAEILFRSQGFGLYDGSEDLEYTKGSFDGTVYTNEWADIKLKLPDGFSNADSATYATAEDVNLECGVYFTSDDGMSIFYICYEKMPSVPDYDEEEYLDITTSKAVEKLENAGVSYQSAIGYTTETIAGYTYTKAENSFNNGYGDFKQTVCVRKIGNYMVYISAVGTSEESNDALIRSITTVY